MEGKRGRKRKQEEVEVSSAQPLFDVWLVWSCDSVMMARSTLEYFELTVASELKSHSQRD
jgi:hypothetical protein